METAAITGAINDEFTRGWSAIPVGIVSHCFLGPPFEAHTLGLEGSIIEHFRVGESLPGQLQEARPLTRTDTYLCIEVYPDRLVCVRADGTITVMGAS
ncbi:hypothetical protein [Actinomycetospora chiangmaiensis]|uniref:hypothetical protein n=1 Tax=Actinomycetospora chiangmaiensis TaxID=402650 RepID=UPI00037F79AE|nr:hypothetical protein [Actinomycetospora chiangmaiensis]